MSEKHFIENLNQKKQLLEQYKQDLRNYQNNTDYEKASELLYKKIPDLEEEVKQIDNQHRQAKSDSLIQDYVSENQIAEIVSK